MKLSVATVITGTLLLGLMPAGAGEVSEKLDGFIVHEWGVQIRAQVVVTHAPQERPGQQQGKPQNLLTAPTELIAGLPRFVLRHEQQFQPTEKGREWLKPILHFYGPEGLDCEVKVLTPKGKPLAYWPKPELITQTFWNMSSGLTDSVGMSWSGKLSKRPVATPAEVNAADWWELVRQIPSQWINTPSASERFIFYEASAVQEPLLTGQINDVELSLVNGHVADSGPVVVIVNDGTSRNFVSVPNVAGKATVKISRKDLLSTDGAEDKLLAACRAQWQAFGMTEEEAIAIVETWKPDLLHKTGFVVAARMPSEVYNTLFPLEIIPKPDKVVRAGIVFDTLPGEDARLGWLPNLEKTYEQWSKDLAAESFETREAAVKRFRTTGDLAKPFLERLAKSPDAHVQSAANMLLARLQPRTLNLPIDGSRGRPQSK